MNSVGQTGSSGRLSTCHFAWEKRSRFLLLLENTFVVFAILVFSRALLFNLLEPGVAGNTPSLNATEDSPSGISQPRMFWLYLFVYSGLAVMILSCLRIVIRALLKEKFVLILILLAALSILWSTDRRETLMKVIALLACTLFGVYLAIRYNTRQQLQLLTVAFFFIILLSFIVALGAPQIGIMHGVHTGIWRGVFLHKNGLGSCMVLAGIVSILLTMEVSKYRWIFHSTFWLALILLCLSCSKSALLTWIILFFSLGVYFARSNRPKMAVIASLSVVLAVGSFALQYKYKVMPPILLAQITTSIASQGFGQYMEWENIVADFEAVQRGAPIAAYLDTGGGRLRLWGHLSKKIQDRPWLGYCVGGFWRGMHGPSADIWKLEPWRPTHAHNGFIDVWLDLGAIGLGVLLLSIIAAFFGCITAGVNHYLDLDLLFPLAIISGLCLLKIGEGGLLSANSLAWILLVAAVINVQMRLRPSGERSVSSRSPITYNKKP